MARSFQGEGEAPDSQDSVARSAPSAPDTADSPGGDRLGEGITWEGERQGQGVPDVIGHIGGQEGYSFQPTVGDIIGIGLSFITGGPIGGLMAAGLAYGKDRISHELGQLADATGIREGFETFVDTNITGPASRDLATARAMNREFGIHMTPAEIAEARTNPDYADLMDRNAQMGQYDPDGTRGAPGIAVTSGEAGDPDVTNPRAGPYAGGRTPGEVPPEFQDPAVTEPEEEEEEEPVVPELVTPSPVPGTSGYQRYMQLYREANTDFVGMVG